MNAYYYVSEGVFGEQAIWRVVRSEVNSRGCELLSSICACGTKRAALTMARSMNTYRRCEQPTNIIKQNSYSGQIAINTGQHSNLYR